MDRLTLHPDRFLGSGTAGSIARDLYDGIRDLPLLCPHGHVDPATLALDRPFPEPTALIVSPDHYISRMLYSQGIPLQDLGVPTLDGTPSETDPRAVWRIFAQHYHLFLGTPTRVWLDYVFYELFGIRYKLSGETAERAYDQINDQLADPAFQPRALFERFKIEVLATTDAATDPLDHHSALRQSGWGGRVIPTFRPDRLFEIARPGWPNVLASLSRSADIDISSFADFVRAVELRRTTFRELGATATDHGVASARTARLAPVQLDTIFSRAARGNATAEDQSAFIAHMLLESARMSTEDGLVMQLHAGSRRNHNHDLFQRFGSDVGADIPTASEFTDNLGELLNSYGNDPRLTLVVFTLDESTYSRELAPLAGHYPALKLGPAWWFFDSVDGMLRYRELTTETAGLYNTAGFNDDTRAFLSIPARHDLARRVDAHFLASLVSRHQIDMADARLLSEELAYGLAKRTYRL